MGSSVEIQVQDCLYWAWWTLPVHQKPSHRKDKVMQCKIHCTWTAHWVLEHQYANQTQLYHLVNIPSVPTDQLYKDMINSNRPIIPFVSTNESIDDAASLWTLFSHIGLYVIAIGLLISAGLGIFCCYFFWCWPARLAHWPLLLGFTWHTIVNDDVETASIYRCDGKAGSL